jgi:hypothetical protein
LGRLPVEFDNEQVSLETAYNAVLAKANHRKLLVTDIRGEGYETLVTSANPHNGSAYSVNSAITVKGATAQYVYNVLRKDMMHSRRLGHRYTQWHHDATRKYRKNYFEETFPAIEIDDTPRGDIAAQFVTENKIPKAVIRMLEGVEEGDEIRIQMFYLSFQPVLDAILSAAAKTEKPARLLLDVNKDTFSNTRVKDGTPNRQVARYLLREAGDRIEVRWYSTHGEQNHTKIMSITNPGKKRYLITTGSCNWTGRNMDGVNMEANVVVDGAPELNDTFNEYFDLFWSNADGNEYSVGYEAFRDKTAPDKKWRRGEKPRYWGTF